MALAGPVHPGEPHARVGTEAIGIRFASETR